MTDRRDDVPHKYLPRTVGEPREIAVDGKLWLVYERENRFDRRAGRVLVFQQFETLRFLRQYPANWRELSDEALYRLTIMS